MVNPVDVDMDTVVVTDLDISVTMDSIEATILYAYRT
jgi:hypothetical protein